MKTIKLKDFEPIPRNYTGIIEYTDEDIFWCKNGKPHREDGPARIYKDGCKEWWLDSQRIHKSICKINLTNQIILSKTKHPLYLTVQVWKILDKDRVYEQIVIPGMEECIKE